MPTKRSRYGKIKYLEFQILAYVQLGSGCNHLHPICTRQTVPYFAPATPLLHHVPPAPSYVPVGCPAHAVVPPMTPLCQVLVAFIPVLYHIVPLFHPLYPLHLPPPRATLNACAHLISLWCLFCNLISLGSSPQPITLPQSNPDFPTPLCESTRS